MPFQIGYTKFALLYDSTYSFDESGRPNQNIFFSFMENAKTVYCEKRFIFPFPQKVLIPCFRFKIDYILGFPC